MENIELKYLTCLTMTDLHTKYEIICERKISIDLTLKFRLVNTEKNRKR